MPDWLSLIIATIALLTSFFVVWITNRNFNLSNRPYLTVQSYAPHANINPNELSILVIRTPAKILRGQVCLMYGNDCHVQEILYSILTPTKEVPFSTTPIVREIFPKLAEGQELVREVYIEYEWPGKNKPRYHSRYTNWFLRIFDIGSKKYSYYAKWTFKKDLWPPKQGAPRQEYWKIEHQSVDSFRPFHNDP